MRLFNFVLFLLLLLILSFQVYISKSVSKKTENDIWQFSMNKVNCELKNNNQDHVISSSELKEQIGAEGAQSLNDFPTSKLPEMGKYEKNRIISLNLPCRI